MIRELEVLSEDLRSEKRTLREVQVILRKVMHCFSAQFDTPAGVNAWEREINRLDNELELLLYTCTVDRQIPEALQVIEKAKTCLREYIGSNS